MEFRTLSGITIETITEAFQDVFGDYAVKFDSREIESMLRRRGFAPDLSFAAFEDGHICAFLLNGYGNFNGNICCYDCGTGTLPDYRGRGLAGKLFQASLPTLMEAGVKDYILEVLKSNTPAINVYRKEGFEIAADYDCYNVERKALVIDKLAKIDFSIKRGDVTVVERSAGFCDFTSSWQNSLESIKRAGDDLIILSAEKENKTIGYCVFDPLTGDITQLAVERSYRKQGVGSLLLKQVIEMITSPKAKILNIPTDCESISMFIKSAGFEKGLSQYGMRKRLAHS